VSRRPFEGGVASPIVRENARGSNVAGGAVKRANMPPMRGFLRVNGWQRTGIVLSVLWVSCASMWFMQQIPAHQPGIASIYLQCITEPNSHRSVCNARANSFRKEARLDVRTKWPWVALAPVVVVWIFAYIIVWLARWIVAPVAPPIRKANE
jgi:hypothetical protein